MKAQSSDFYLEKQENEEKNRIVTEFLKQEIVVGSWGITDLKIEENSVSFRVSAFKYEGVVQIKCDGDKFSVRIEQKDITGLELSSVVETIDDEIEMSSDYYDKVAKWIVSE